MQLYNTFNEALAAARKWNAINISRLGKPAHQKFLKAKVEPMGAAFCASIFNAQGEIVDRLAA